MQEQRLTRREMMEDQAQQLRKLGKAVLTQWSEDIIASAQRSKRADATAGNHYDKARYYALRIQARARKLYRYQVQGVVYEAALNQIDTLMSLHPVLLEKNHQRYVEITVPSEKGYARKRAFRIGKGAALDTLHRLKARLQRQQIFAQQQAARLIAEIELQRSLMERFRLRAAQQYGEHLIVTRNHPTPALTVWCAVAGFEPQYFLRKLNEYLRREVQL